MKWIGKFTFIFLTVVSFLLMLNFIYIFEVLLHVFPKIPFPLFYSCWFIKPVTLVYSRAFTQKSNDNFYHPVTECNTMVLTKSGLIMRMRRLFQSLVLYDPQMLVTQGWRLMSTAMVHFLLDISFDSFNSKLFFICSFLSLHFISNITCICISLQNIEW